MSYIQFVKGFWWYRLVRRIKGNPKAKKVQCVSGRVFSVIFKAKGLRVSEASQECKSKTKGLRVSKASQEHIAKAKWMRESRCRCSRSYCYSSSLDCHGFSLSKVCNVTGKPGA